MLEYWNVGMSRFTFGGTRSVASGHDGAWPSRAAISFPPIFHHSHIPSFQFDVHIKEFIL